MLKSTASDTPTDGYDPNFGARVSVAYHRSVERDRLREKKYGTAIATLTRPGGTPSPVRNLYTEKKDMIAELDAAYDLLSDDERKRRPTGAIRAWIQALESRIRDIERCERDYAAKLARELLVFEEDEPATSLEKLAITKDSQAPGAGLSRSDQPSLSTPEQPSMVKRHGEEPSAGTHEHPASTSAAKNSANDRGVPFRNPSLD
ncbi:hypothetical protein DBV05_g11184 [Lasiodiplodia theobromae]|uniref:Uncharacterized protein n=1 Tax=Lasiodiplodia theobromae TaxID=45133 RepID=A0A5N5CXY5_9PEZI|nr:hypothetical protein DBV05_g11184 [Lasiodiplodia theobromae]